MSVTIVVGTNWGDEGKGRMIDYLAQGADVVCRFQGGNNAGHTVVNDYGTFKLHLIPSGIFNKGTTNVLGPGMVINLAGLVDELDVLRAGGIPEENLANVLVSDRATICFPFHGREDEWEEERLGDEAFGSTRQGIAPAYADRYLKKAIQVGELLHPERLKERLRKLVEWKNLVAKGVWGKDNAINFDEVYDWTVSYGKRVAPMITDTTDYMDRSHKQGKTILFEAQLGALRDVMFGVYPYTSSSTSLAGFATIGGSLFGRTPDRVVGVMKAFSTCVGEGPFVTEQETDAADSLRETAFEYGAATGRPRRIGHFDALASREGAYIQGATEIALTKMDCLSDLDPLLICTHYEWKGKRIDRLPINAVLEEATPVYKEMKGWTGDLTGVRSFCDLPATAQEFVLEIERLVERPIRFVSVGPEREALIDRGNGSGSAAAGNHGRSFARLESLARFERGHRLTAGFGLDVDATDRELADSL